VVHALSSEISAGIADHLLERNMSEPLSPGDIRWFVPRHGGRPVEVKILSVFEELEIPCAEVFETVDSKYRTLALADLSDTAKEARLKRKGLVK
jgi:hypothetical protein